MKDDNGRQHYYMHMSTDPVVSVNQRVTRGQLLGTRGNTGDSYGNHVHFAISAPNGGTNWVNPETELANWPSY
jgi:murein DD-endopeptidase MepM/ murein hydrolase activator NlpD